ncbi:MAG: DUF992 domain-containing protein [Rhizobiales bacterium]|nr:DUF992 domain-containing protein [Hyphomicrobiales bacterium]
MKFLQRTYWTAAAAAVIFASAIPAQAGGVKAGILKCKVDGGFGLFVTSKKNVECVFRPRLHRWRDHYVGSITKIGADIGFTNGSYLVWTVFAPGSLKRGSLEGTYLGASGEATAGVGLGANVLLGGFDHSINLQPVSFQGQSGLNVAAGIAGLTLNSH